MSEYTIETGVPLIKREKFPVSQLELGESFLVPFLISSFFASFFARLIQLFTASPFKITVHAPQCP